MYEACKPRLASKSLTVGSNGSNVGTYSRVVGCEDHDDGILDYWCQDMDQAQVIKYSGWHLSFAYN